MDWQQFKGNGVVGTEFSLCTLIKWLQLATFDYSTDRKYRTIKNVFKETRSGLVVEHFPSMHEDLGLIPSTGVLSSVFGNTGNMFTVCHF